MTHIELIGEDVERLRRGFPELDEAVLLERLVAAALFHRAHDWDRKEPLEGFVHGAAALATYRQQLMGMWETRLDVRENERIAYETQIELDRDVIPPLKQEAKRLRSEIRTMETGLRAKGLDPSNIEPLVEEPGIPVDDYQPPRFVHPAERRRQVAEFFRRTGGDR